MTLAPYPTEALLDRYLPDVPRRTRFPGRMSPVDTTRAKELLRFEPDHIFPVRDSTLP